MYNGEYLGNTSMVLFFLYAVTCSFLIRSVKQHDLHDLEHDSLFSVCFQGETFPFANQTSQKDATYRMN